MDGFDKISLKKHLTEHLQRHMIPRKIIVEMVKVGHRHKRT